VDVDAEVVVDVGPPPVDDDVQPRGKASAIRASARGVGVVMLEGYHADQGRVGYARTASTRAARSGDNPRREVNRWATHPE
jgi:hypothetical protein